MISDTEPNLRTKVESLAVDFYLYMQASTFDRPQPTVRQVIDAYFHPIIAGLTDHKPEQITAEMQAIAVIRERAIPDRFLDKPVSEYLADCAEGLITPFYESLQ